MFRNSIQDGTKFYYSTTPSDDVLYDMEIHHKISMPNYQKLKTMVKRRKRSEITITKL